MHTFSGLYIIRLLDLISTSSRTSGSSAGSVLLALTLLWLQVWRRLYDCLFVHVKSKATMNILHYIVGYAHYFCTALGILSEAPIFAPDGSKPSPIDLKISNTQILMSILFVYAWYNQFKAHQTFASYRKGKKATNANLYVMPTGGWFEYVSSPHYLAEIVMYTCLLGILGPSHQTAWVIWIWVVSNQVIVAIMSHMWYLDKFKDYPKDRKIVLPFIL